MTHAKDKRSQQLRDALRANLRRRKADPSSTLASPEKLVRRADPLSPRLEKGLPKPPKAKNSD